MQKWCQTFAISPTLYLGTVGPDGEHELYDGKLGSWMRMEISCMTSLIRQNILMYIAESSVNWSYLTYPYYKPLGFDKGFYRVGPLARLNVAQK